MYFTVGAKCNFYSTSDEIKHYSGFCKMMKGAYGIHEQVGGTTSLPMPQPVN